MNNYENAIEISGLTKRYGGFTLDNLSFNTAKGSIIGFIGQNRAGKTTTIKAVLNIIKADEGTGLIAALSGTNDDESRVLQFFTVGAAAVFIAAAVCIAEQVVCQRRGKSALQ